MSKSKPSPAASHRRRKRSTFVRQVTRGALFAISLTAAQLALEESLVPRLFDRGLLDRLKAPLSRHHE